MQAVLIKLAFLILLSKEAACQCDTGIYVNKTHTWNKGYTANLYLDQSWLTQQTADWKVTITFCNEVGQFKVWDADIVNPVTKNKYVNDVTRVEIINKCWNPILYPCQDLDLAFLVRFPEEIADKFSSDFDIVAVTESVTYECGSSGNRTYCPLLTDSMCCVMNTATAKTPTTSMTPTTTTSTTTPATCFQNCQIKFLATNSQNNDPVQGVTGNVSLHMNGSDVIIARDVQFDLQGIAYVPAPSNGHYSIELQAEGFITKHAEDDVVCIPPTCLTEKRVIMSPHLLPGQTRIIMTWKFEDPTDVDLHVMAIKKSDNSTCRTYFDNKVGCPSVSQDLDNIAGGPNGPETVTLLNKTVNMQYTYLIAIEDYNFQNNGSYFLTSGAAISITNEKHTRSSHQVINTIDLNMEATSIDETTDYYLFGCLEVLTNGGFSFTAAPNGTFFNGNDFYGTSPSGTFFNDEWLAMMTAFC